MKEYDDNFFVLPTRITFALKCKKVA